VHSIAKHVDTRLERIDRVHRVLVRIPHLDLTPPDRVTRTVALHALIRGEQLESFVHALAWLRNVRWMVSPAAQFWQPVRTTPCSMTVTCVVDVQS